MYAFPVLSVSALQIEVEDECGHRFCCSFAETVPKVASPPSEAAGELLQVFSVDAHTAKQLRHFKFLSVSFMAQLLASSHFIRKVCVLQICVRDSDCFFRRNCLLN